MTNNIINLLNNNFPGLLVYESKTGEVVAKVEKNNLIDVCNFLKNSDGLKFNQLSDLCGVDYLRYSKSNWDTVTSTDFGFSRAQISFVDDMNYIKNRFSVVYNLLSYTYNHRIRLQVFVSMDDLIVPSVVDFWPTAEWHERETFDFFGIIFSGHPNLIRILTDYGFEYYPLRKDFPVTGKDEIRYDIDKGKLVYEPTSVRKMNAPKVVRDDFRYK